MIKKICVAGAGTMGSGIALSAAQHHFSVVLFDIQESVLQAAKQMVQANLDFLEKKQKISSSENTDIFNRILFSNNIHDCKADVIIEAIVEKIEIKEKFFQQLADINPLTTIFASNTSSLSISLIQSTISHPERVIGMHFFNPAQIMKLVEVVKGASTNDETENAIVDLCIAMGKKPVRCNDAPGFIVNRVARHYYLETMYLIEKGITTIEDADKAMEAAGFKMGPFKLMDLIGMDINLAVSESIYAAFQFEKRFKPSVLQQEKVRKGELGKKTGIGFYHYQ